MSMLIGRDLELSFGRTRALAGVSLSVEAQEIVAVMGQSGSGKSSLVHCLAGILRPDRGEISFAGERIDELSDRERSALRARSFGFVLQFGELIPELSLAENAALPLRLRGLGRKAAMRRALEFLERLEIASSQHKRPSEVSGGEAQRAAIARALVHSPRVVFADEPTGALDTENAEIALEMLTTAARELGTAVVLVTHEPWVAAYAHRQVVMRNGSIVVAADAST